MTGPGQEPAPHRIEPGRVDAPPAPPCGRSGDQRPPRSDLTADERLRVEALQAAAHWHIGSTLTNEDAGPWVVVVTARVFEAYLRGDQ